MRKTAITTIFSKQFAQIATNVLVLACFFLLSGCQVMNAASPKQSQTSILTIGTSLNFGSVAPGTSKVMAATATNSGPTSITINSASITAKYFSIAGPSLPITLAAGESAPISIQFTPAMSGSFSANVAVISNAANSRVKFAVSGSATSNSGTLAASPTSASFGSVTVGTQQTQTLTLSNSSATSVTVSGVSATGTGFSVSGITAPLTLNAGQSASFSVTFKPAAVGSVSGSVTLSSNSSNPTFSVPLSGSGASVGTLSVSASSVSFGTVTIGSSQTLADSITNTGGTAVTISGVTASGSGYSVNGISLPLTLNAGQSTSFVVSFTPTSSGTASGNATILSNASNPTITVPLSGTGASLGSVAVSASNLSFGSVTVGSSATLSETVTNNGGTAVAISGVTTSGSGFSVSGISLPLTLNAGQSKSFSVTFAPTSSGTASGNATILSNASNATLNVPLSGTGASTVGTLSVTPTAMNLGSVVVGSSATASGTLTASGGSVTVNTATTTDSGVFNLGGLSLPATIPAGGSVAFTVTFSPTVSGTANATLTFTSNAQISTTSAALTGSGAASPTHTVDLSWNPSTSSNISGYNVYRAPFVSSCGSFSRINNVLNTTMIYADAAVTNGSSYCYATTAVDSSNVESTYSNIVSNVVIPNP